MLARFLALFARFVAMLGCFLSLLDRMSLYAMYGIIRYICGSYIGPGVLWRPGVKRRVGASKGLQIRSPDTSFHSPSILRYFEKKSIFDPEVVEKWLSPQGRFLWTHFRPPSGPRSAVGTFRQIEELRRLRVSIEVPAHLLRFPISFAIFKKSNFLPPKSPQNGLKAP